MDNQAGNLIKYKTRELYSIAAGNALNDSIYTVWDTDFQFFEPKKITFYMYVMNAAHYPSTGTWYSNVQFYMQNSDLEYCIPEFTTPPGTITGFNANDEFDIYDYQLSNYVPVLQVTFPSGFRYRDVHKITMAVQLNIATTGDWEIQYGYSMWGIYWPLSGFGFDK